MFGILNNKIQLNGADISTPVSNLTVGYSIITGQNLFVNGPYSSLSGSLTVGRDLIVTGSLANPGIVSTAAFASITGNTVVGSALNVLGTITGTALQIVGPFSSITGNQAVGSALIVFGTITGTALQIIGPFASVTGNASIGSALNVSGTISGTALQITGPFASVTGNIVAGSSLIAATVTSNLLTVANTADIYGRLTARAGTGGVQINNAVNPSLQLVSSSGTSVELGLATSSSAFSSSAMSGDLVLRTLGGGRLLLTTGIGNPAMVCSGTMVGINTTPTTTLDILGNVRCVGSNSATWQVASAPSSTGFASFSALTDTGSSTQLFQNGSARTSDGGTLSCTLRNNAGGDIRILNSASSGITIQGSSGFVGIGTGAPAFNLDTSGSFRCTSNLLADNANLGDCGYGTNYAGFAHSSRFSTGNYSFLSDNTGGTYINCATGNQINFRCNNAQTAVLNSSGAFTCNAINLPALSAAALIPTGTIWSFGGGSAPTGWLLCIGTAVSRTTYSALYAVIGTTYGSGDGTSTFNLPDVRGRAPIGAGSGSGLTARSPGNSGGEENHTLSWDEMPSHYHGVNDGGHSHYLFSYKDGGGNSTGPYREAPSPNYQKGLPNNPFISQNTASSGANVSIQNAGSSYAHNNMQPFLVLNYIIRY